MPKPKQINVQKEVPIEIGTWLEKQFEQIKEIYKDTNKLEKFLLKGFKISQKDIEWFQAFKENFKKLEKPEEKLQLLYDLYLSSQGLLVEYPEGETIREYKPKKSLRCPKR